MKKLMATVFVTVLMAAGLVIGTSSTASANCFPTKYSGCIQTRTNVSSPAAVAKKRRATLCATVQARRSNATPIGRVVIKVKRNQGGYFQKSSLAYAGGSVCLRTKKLRLRGGYTVVAKFKSPGNSVFVHSRGAGGFDVVS